MPGRFGPVPGSSRSEDRDAPRKAFAAFASDSRYQSGRAKAAKKAKGVKKGLGDGTIRPPGCLPLQSSWPTSVSLVRYGALKCVIEKLCDPLVD